MRLAHHRCDAVQPASAGDWVSQSLAVLGLAPTADGALVQLAYQHQAAVCRRTLPDGAARERRLAVLENARLLLRDAASDSDAADLATGTGGTDRSGVTPSGGAARAAPRGGPPWRAGDLWTSKGGHEQRDRWTNLQGSRGGGRSQGARRLDSYWLLGVHPSTDDQLITIAYRHLLTIAAAQDDAERLAALECAYARVGSSTARAVYERDAQAHGATTPASETNTSSPARLPPLRRVFRRGVRAAEWLLTATTRAALDGVRWPRSLVRRAAVPLRSASRMQHRAASDSVAGSDRTALAPVPAGRAAYDAQAPSALPRWKGHLAVVARPINTLRVSQGGAVLLQLELKDYATYTIGSGPHVDVRLASPQDSDDLIAAEHARLTVGASWLAFEHLPSHAVSSVNGTPAIWTLLKPGDCITIGPYQCEYRVYFDENKRSALP